jgi:hypothetical protein
MGGVSSSGNQIVNAQLVAEMCCAVDNLSPAGAMVWGAGVDDL